MTLPTDLTSESIQPWLDELTNQSPAFASLFTNTKIEQEERGYYHTLREICQQPITWHNTTERAIAWEPTLRMTLKNSGGVDQQADIFLTGSGSSFYVGECLRLGLQRELGVRVQAVSAGALLTHAPAILPARYPCMLISFARSGDSPESVAAIHAAQQVNPRCQHLVVTCNRFGKLAVLPSTDSHIAALLLDDQTCDRSLVMTSSFTNMVWAGRFLGMFPEPQSYRERSKLLAQMGKKILASGSTELSVMARSEFRSVVYLGSGDHFGAARESALKMLEMTNGQVTTFAETYLSVRHGPLSAILPDTLIVCYLSADTFVRAYELDLIREINRKKIGLSKVILGESIPADLMNPEDLALEYAGLNLLGDDNTPILDALVGQLLAFFRCLQLGLRPDSPSYNGIISRVVGEFVIHRRQ